MAFSINQYSDLYFRMKTFREHYRAVSINIPVSKYKNLFTLCTSRASEHIKFDYWGMYATPFAPDVVLSNRKREVHGTTPNLLATCFPEACLG